MTVLQEHPRVVLVAALALILFAGFRVVQQRGSPHKEEIKAYYNDMVHQAEEVTRELPEGAKVVVLVFDGELKVTSDKNFRLVYRALEKKGLSILHVERLIYDEANGWSRFATKGFPYNEYVRVAGEYPEADAVLSLCGAPYFSGSHEKPDPSSMPGLLLARVVIDPSRLVEEGWVEAAAVYSDTGDESGSGYSYEVLRRGGSE